MKKLSILLTIFTLLITSISNAQTNDANWGQTISFINKYKKHITHLYRYSSEISGEQISEFNINNKIMTIKIDYYELTSNGRVFTTYKDMKYSADLSKITKVEVDKEVLNTIEIRFSSDLPGEGYLKANDKGETNFTYKKFQGYSWYILEIDDSEIFKRYLKAFEHLAYLAKQEREKNIKESGDKF